MTIDELLAVAVGEIGMTVTDFDSLTHQEFSLIWQKHCNAIDTQFKYTWEQTRFLCCTLLQPNTRKILQPRDICTFPWEAAEDKKEPAHRQTADEIREIFKKKFAKSSSYHHHE